MKTTPITNDEGRYIGRSFKCTHAQCGRTVEAYLGEDTECSRCGTEYNAFGQALAPRAQWFDYITGE